MSARRGGPVTGATAAPGKAITASMPNTASFMPIPLTIAPSPMPITRGGIIAVIRRAPLSDSIFKQPSNLSYPSPARGEGGREHLRAAGGGKSPSAVTPPRRFAPTLPFRGRDKQAGARHRPCSLRRGVRRLSAFALRASADRPFFLSAKPRGWSTEWRTSLSVAASSFEGCGRLSALHRGVFTPAPGRAFGVRFVLPCGSKLPAPFGSTAHTKSRASLNGPPSASSWQGTVVSPGGAPAPPGCGGYVSSPARRRRIPPRYQNVS